jgi:hypothetical protein
LEKSSKIHLPQILFSFPKSKQSCNDIQDLGSTLAFLILIYLFFKKKLAPFPLVLIGRIFEKHRERIKEAIEECI